MKVMNNIKPNENTSTDVNARLLLRYFFHVQTNISLLEKKSVIPDAVARPLNELLPKSTMYNFILLLGSDSSIHSLSFVRSLI